MLVFQLAAGLAIFQYVLSPLAKRSADDFSAFLVISARTWAELPPETRPAFAAELAESHRIALSDEPEPREEDVAHHPYMNLLRDALEARIGRAQARLTQLPDGRFHVDVPMGGHELHFSFPQDAVSQSPLKALWWILGAGLAVSLATAWLEEILKGISEKDAVYEAKRCLSCGNCFECDGCYGSCPEDAIIKLGPGKKYRYDYSRCTGCGTCMEQCPCHAIEMVPESANGQ